MGLMMVMMMLKHCARSISCPSLQVGLQEINPNDNDQNNNTNINNYSGLAVLCSDRHCFDAECFSVSKVRQIRVVNIN